MVSSADHRTGAAGLAPVVTLSKDGGPFGPSVGVVSEIGHGWYALAGDAEDRNTRGPLILHATAEGADPTEVLCEIVAHDPYDVPSLMIGVARQGDVELALDGWGQTLLQHVGTVEDSLPGLATAAGLAEARAAVIAAIPETVLASGTGKTLRVFTSVDRLGRPIEGVRVAVFTDAALTVQHGDVQTSNTEGQTFWLIDAGTYYVVQQKSGYVFPVEIEEYP